MFEDQRAGGVWGRLNLGRAGGEGRGTGRTHPEVHSQSRVQRHDVTSGQGEKSILFEMSHGRALHVTSQPGAPTRPWYKHCPVLLL